MAAEIPCIVPTQFAGIDLEWTDEKKEEYMKANQWRKETVLTRKMRDMIGNPESMAIVQDFPNTGLAMCSTYLTAVIIMVREHLKAKYPYSHTTRNLALKLHWLSQLRSRIPTPQWKEICQIAQEWYSNVQKERRLKKSCNLARSSEIRAFYHDKLKEIQRKMEPKMLEMDASSHFMEPSLEELGSVDFEKDNNSWWP